MLNHYLPLLLDLKLKSDHNCNPKVKRHRSPQMYDTVNIFPTLLLSINTIIIFGSCIEFHMEYTKLPIVQHLLNIFSHYKH